MIIIGRDEGVLQFQARALTFINLSSELTFTATTMASIAFKVCETIAKFGFVCVCHQLKCWRVYMYYMYYISSNENVLRWFVLCKFP